MAAKSSMRLPHKTLEKKLFRGGYQYVIGVDEVGMGCLAGPAVVCAISFSRKFFKKTHKKLRWLRDSKLLLPHQREKFVSELLKEKGLKFQTARCLPKTIDKINIYQAARSAMRRAIRKLGDGFWVLGIRNLKPITCNPKPKVIVLVDGKTKITGLDIPQMAVVKGDRKVFSIACASIIAKVARDKMMKNYAKKFPHYGFERHKGYATKFHQVQLAIWGPCKIHRRSFAPVAKLL
jgi:ribonuclease HII